MAQYIKCPVCELNYIQAGEKHCKLCSPDMMGKSLADMETEYDEIRQERWKEQKKRRESMDAFRAYRYNL